MGTHGVLGLLEDTRLYGCRRRASFVHDSMKKAGSGQPPHTLTAGIGWPATDGLDHRQSLA